MYKIQANLQLAEILANNGIYEVSSNALTVCYDLRGEGYPKSFETSPGSRLVVYEFRRE